MGTGDRFTTRLAHQHYRRRRLWRPFSDECPSDTYEEKNRIYLEHDIFRLADPSSMAPGPCHFGLLKTKRRLVVSCIPRFSRIPNPVFLYSCLEIRTLAIKQNYSSFFAILFDLNERMAAMKKSKKLSSPSIYIHAVVGFLLVQTGQKFVRELVVAASQRLVSVILVLILTLITIGAAILLLRRNRRGLALGIFSGAFLIAQPIIYHIIMGRPCLGGIWWYPFFTALQGVFILYFSLTLWCNERTLDSRK